jgi:hypothetical protein
MVHNSLTASGIDECVTADNLPFLVLRLCFYRQFFPLGSCWSNKVSRSYSLHLCVRIIAFKSILVIFCILSEPLLTRTHDTNSSTGPSQGCALSTVFHMLLESTGFLLVSSLVFSLGSYAMRTKPPSHKLILVRRM